MSKNFIAVKSFFVESGTYQPVFLRPYETNYDEQVAQDYYVETEGGTKIVPSAFSKISSSILKPTAAHQGTINIDNGWNERRMSFVIEVSVPDSFGDSKNVVLTGYTNHTDVGLTTKAFDPNMRLYLNTSTIVTTLHTRTPHGGYTQRKSITDSSHLLNATVMNNIRTNMALQDPYRDGTLWYATPSNVINEMSNIKYAGDNQGMYGNRQVVDFRQRTSDKDVRRSRRENTIPTTYLSKILRGVTDGLTNMGAGIGVDENDALINASVAVREQQLSVDPLIVELALKTGYGENGFVTWRELTSIVPNLDAETKFTNRASQVVQTNIPDAVAGNFQTWQGATFETSIANSVSQLLPAMMTTCMIGSVTFAFNNDNPTLTPVATAINGQTMIDGIPFASMSPTLESRFLSEIAPMITNQGRSVVNLFVQCSLGTETYITISRDGEPPVPFCAPTFCDSLYTPVLSTSQQSITDIAVDLQNIANSVNNFNYMANNRYQPNLFQ